MYAFCHKGSGFSGALDYILDAEGMNNKIVQLLGSEGVDIPLDQKGHPIFDTRSIAQSFQIQAAMRPGISKPVRHLILSCPPEDKEKLSPRLWVQIAKEYMGAMHIDNTQFIIAAHKEKDNPHIHIIYNYVNNYGESVEEKFFKKRSTEVCRAITEKYDLHWGSEKALSQLEAIHKPEDQILYQTARVVTEELYYSSNMSEFRMNLMSRGIQVRETHHGSREGILFVVNGTNGNQYTFAGSRLGRHLTCSKINAYFQHENDNRRSMARETRLSANVVVSHIISLITSLIPPAETEGYQPNHSTEGEQKDGKHRQKASGFRESFRECIK